MPSEKKYYVNFGPQLLSLLGPNLYTNIYYVLGELIANAYDADAENVYIIYSNENNTIVVEDDGIGMTHEDVNKHFLPVGIPTRFDKETSYTKQKERRKMGRKGIGKLGALTVSSRVKILTKKDGVKSGCVLSLEELKKGEKEYEIPGIPEAEITFKKINETDHGSAIVMSNCRYTINKTMGSAKKNISLIFPLTSQDFKIHIFNEDTGEKATIDDYSKEVIKFCDTLITFSDSSSPINDQMESLHGIFYKDRYYDELKAVLPQEKMPQKKSFNQSRSPIREEILSLEKRNGEKENYTLFITGWVATFASTHGKKKSTDFPSVHLSIISQGKMGEFNIIPQITFNRVNESYVVGQLHIDLLEETELPDISLSNRQGYKDDDLRYIRARELIKEQVLKKILNLKSEATDYKNIAKKLKQKELLKEEKRQFEQIIKDMTRTPSFKELIDTNPEIRTKFEQSWELKNTIKRKYKKILISHASESKTIIDEFEKVLHYCGIEDTEIIYTSSDHEDSRFGTYEDLFKYLKDFFVDTFFDPSLCVVYFFNKEFISKWGSVLEAGAGWVLKTHFFNLYTDTYENVKDPLKKGAESVPKCTLGMTTPREIQELANGIMKICEHVGINVKTKQEVIEYIKTTKLYT